MPAAPDHNDPFLSHSQPQGRKQQTLGRDQSKTFKATTQKARKVFPVHSGGHSLANSCCLVLLPLLEFVILVSLFLFLHYKFPTLTWSVVFACLLGSCVMVVLSLLARSNLGFYFALGISCIVACVLATLLGIFGYHQFMRDFWWMSTGRHYTSLDATTPAASRGDASWLHFNNGTKVDSARSVGFRDGAVYCAAPVLNAATATRVHYWAVGKDCCQKRSSFACDDAADLGASSAVVLMEGTSPFTAQETLDHVHYLRAIRQAEAAFDLVSADGALLLKWVRDPKAISWQLLNNGFLLLGVGAAAEFIISLILFCFLPQPNKAELP